MKRWTDEEDKTLLDCYKVGFSLKKIAHVLHRTPKAIEARLYLYHDTERKIPNWTKDEKEKLLWGCPVKGKTNRAIRIMKSRIRTGKIKI